MRRTIFWFVMSAVLFLFHATSWATESLLDEELDQISAMGDFTLNIGDNGSGMPTVNFGFQTGGTTGNGQIVIQPGTGTLGPGTITAGSVNFNNSLIRVDNMIFNMNICMQCQATTLTQGNLGVPVTIKVAQ